MPEPLFGFQQGLGVALIEPVPSIAAMIHDYLSCHRWLLKPPLCPHPQSQGSRNVPKLTDEQRDIEERALGRGEGAAATAAR